MRIDRGKLDIKKLIAASGHKKLIGMCNHNICSVLKKRESNSYILVHNK